MDKDFWLRRWQKREIGFHKSHPHPQLVRFFPLLNATSIFVPLCGKTQDLVWLAQQGVRVLGVELSEIAVQEFFSENAIPHKMESKDPFKVYRSSQITIYCGDFFKLTPEMLDKTHVFYDRAAIIALPDAMRSAYVAHLKHLLGSKARGLSITLEYPDGMLEGPPFSVSHQDLRTLFSEYKIQTLDRVSDRDFQARFTENAEDLVFEETSLIRP